MFRCPSCARVGKLPLTKGYSLLAHKDLNKWTIEKEPISFFSKVEEVYTLEELAAALSRLGLELEMKGDTYVECLTCQTWSKFAAWNQAWELPGDFFDADQLCSCGEELWYDRIPGTNRYGLICEACNWAKPRAIISGHEG